MVRPDVWVGQKLVRRTNPLLDNPIAKQIEARGFSRTDVRDIIVTHLDLDHAGGLADFPAATVHVHQAELDAATQSQQMRYRPIQFEHGPKWKTYDDSDSSDENWLGFRAVRELTGLPQGILMIPLAGHTCGHVGIAVDTKKGWYLHAGDAYSYHGQMAINPSMPLGARIFQWSVDTQRQQRADNQQRLRELVRDHRA